LVALRLHKPSGKEVVFGGAVAPELEEADLGGGYVRRRGRADEFPAGGKGEVPRRAVARDEELAVGAEQVTGSGEGEVACEAYALAVYWPRAKLMLMELL
jgi:hypothetical protein